MNSTIASSLVWSNPQKCYPHGDLVARATVNYLENKDCCSYKPVKLTDVCVDNQNGSILFSSKQLNINAARAIAKGLLEIADAAEQSNARMNKANAE